MSFITMTSTVGELTNGQTYRVRAKTAETLIAQNKGTKSNVKRISAAYEGKSDK